MIIITQFRIFFAAFQFSTVEVIITSLKDGFGDWIDRHIKHHEILVLLVCLLGFAFGIPHIFNVKTIETSIKNN